MSHNLQWNLWTWEGRSWRVQSVHESQADAQSVIDNCGEPADRFTIARNGTPYDNYLRDNVTVHRAPLNYLRRPEIPEKYRLPPEGGRTEGKVADHTARGSYDT